MKLGGLILRDSRKRSIVLLVVALLLSAFIPVSMALVGNNGGRLVGLAEISPVRPVTTDDLVCSVVRPRAGKGGGSLAYVYTWYKDGVPQPQLTGDTVDARYTAKGEVWRCVLTAINGTGSETSQDEVTIRNSSPTAPVADVTPDLPHAADNLLCSIKVPSSDADGDTVTYTYAWYANGEPQPHLADGTVDATNNVRGLTWRCLVTASDGAGGVAGSFDEVTVDSGNSAPSVPTIDLRPVQPISANDLVCSVVGPSTDPDRDPVTYTYAWYKDGVLQPELTGDTVDSSKVAKGETWKCVVTASDGMGGSAGEFCQSTIENSPPTAPVVDVTPEEPTDSDDLVCSIIVPSSDPDGDVVTYAYAWYRNGVLQGELTGNTVDASYAAEGRCWRCVVTASDGAGGSASSYDEVGDIDEMKALYVWSWSWQLFDKVAEEQYFLTVCMEEGINTAFIAATDSDVLDLIQNNPEKIARFIQDANASGIKVYALLARMNYGMEAALQRNVEAILKYNHDTPDYRFEGIHFDFEPPGGSSLSQHAAYLAECTSFFQHMKTWAYDGETIASQDVSLGMFVDPRWSNSVCAQAYRNLVRELDYMDIAAYRSPPATGIGDVQGCVELTVAEGKPFDIALETAEFPYTSDGPTTYYEEGRAGLENCMSVMREYYKTNYPDYFLGFAIHHYENSIQAWHMMKSVQWPSGTYGSGSSVSATVTLHPADYYYWRAYGVKLEVRDGAGNIWVTSRIVCMHFSSNTKEVTLTWTVPSGAERGNCDVRVSVWDVDLHDEGHYSKLFYSDFSATYYGDSTGQRAALEAYSMEGLAALTYRPADPTEPITGKRVPFIELQREGWEQSLFSLT